MISICYFISYTSLDSLCSRLCKFIIFLIFSHTEYPPFTAEEQMQNLLGVINQTENNNAAAAAPTSSGIEVTTSPANKASTADEDA
jgi:hypothetical protein